MKKMKIITIIVFVVYLITACGSEIKIVESNVGSNIGVSDTMMSEQNNVEYINGEGNGDKIMPEFIQYLGMSFDELEAMLGSGELVDFPYEMGYDFTYKFGESQFVCIFQGDRNYETGEEYRFIDQCAAIAIPLKEIITCGDKKQILREEMNKYFTIENWDESPSFLGSHDAPWFNVYSVYGKYFGYHFNAYLEANEENKTSVTVDTYFYFYYDSVHNEPSVNP